MNNQFHHFADGKPESSESNGSIIARGETKRRSRNIGQEHPQFYRQLLFSTSFEDPVQKQDGS
jgi:hypothetical protein